MMINGAMEFENIPLETLIGEFKKQINDFKSVEKIKGNFLDFLSKNTSHTPLKEYHSTVLKPFKERLKVSNEENGFEDSINQASKESIPNFVKEYSNFYNEFDDIIHEKNDKNKIVMDIWKIFSYELNFEGSGIIIAGFDKNSHYPSLFCLNIYCNDDGKLIFKEIESRINCEKPLIRVYAMNEEAYSFLTGVSEEFEYSMKSFVKSSNDELINNMEWYLKNEEIENYKKIISRLKNELHMNLTDLEKYIETFKIDALTNTSDSCEYLPRQLLCELADSLIRLTALKQKLSYDLETVSSENDIAIITKSENLKWAKNTSEIV